MPDNATLKVGFEAFEVIVTFPLAFPADWGVNLTVKLALCPAVKVNGAAIPVMVNPAPLIPTWEIVTVEPPVLVTVSESAWLLPVCTVPKFRLVGVAPNAPTARPVPDNVRDRVGSGAFELMVTLPLAFPVACGVNVTVNVCFERR